MASGHVNRTNRPNTWLHRPPAARVKKVLANPEPSTHGPSTKFSRTCQKASGHWGTADSLSHLEFFAFCEGFQMPAVTNIPHGHRPASENLQGTKPREGARIRRCPRAHYGDLGVGGPQLSQPRGSVER